MKPADIKYASIYDSFTITVLMQLEDLGFCEKGKGGRFVADGNLISGVGKLPFNTDGGGLCNNHPGNRGGMTKVIEAVRQLRGEAHPKVQVPNCDLALAHGTGGSLGPARQRHRHPGEGVDHGRRKERKIPPPATRRRPRPIGTRRKGKLLIRQCTPAARLHHYPRRSVRTASPTRPSGRGVGQGQDLLVQRHAPGAGALRYRLCDAGRGHAMMTNIVDCDFDKVKSSRRSRWSSSRATAARGSDVLAGLTAMRAPRLPIVLLGFSLATTQAAAAPIEPDGRRGQDAPVIGHLAPRVRVTPVETTGVTFKILGSKDGWLLIRDGNPSTDFTLDPANADDGRGWVSGRLVGTTLVAVNLRTAPRWDASVVANFGGPGSSRRAWSCPLSTVAGASTSR